MLGIGGNKTSSCVSLRSVRGTSEKCGQLQGENTDMQSGPERPFTLDNEGGPCVWACLGSSSSSPAPPSTSIGAPLRRSEVLPGAQLVGVQPTVRWCPLFSLFFFFAI